MSPARYLALDVGERRTGLAATDATGTICVPLPRLEHRRMDELPDLVEPLLEERGTQVLVVGVPLLADDSAGRQARRVLEIASMLRQRFPNLEVVTVDESHSTDVAHEQLQRAGVKASRRKRHADSLAALEILRRHLGRPE